MMKKLKLIIIVCFLGLGVGIGQPPPPHPGGSGNQGAPIAYYSLIVLAALSLGVGKKYHLKK